MFRTNRAAIGLALLLTGTGLAYSQAYPNRTVRLIIGTTAGGATDVATRVLAAKLGETVGQQVVVENRTGAGNTLATSTVAKAAPDGYTLLMCPLSDAIAPALYKNLPYVLLRDLTGVSLFGTTANLLTVHPSLPARSIKEFISLAKVNPGKIDYSTTGIGTSPHLSMELLKFRTGIDVLHIPYKGRTMPDLLTGRVAVNFGNLAAYEDPVKAGKLRALGVSTPKRSQRLPEVPTIAESGVPDFDVTVWYGICAPAAVAKDVIDKINGGVTKAVAGADLQQRLIQLGVDPESSTAERFGGLLKSESAKWAKVVKDAGIQPQ